MVRKGYTPEQIINKLREAEVDGLLIEVHPNPKEALVDGLQSLTPSDFARLMRELRSIAKSVGRYI